jgi:hypothetical protein
MLELAITLTKEDTLNKFAKALASLLSNAHIVGPKFVINPIEPISKDKDITTIADISTNMTKLGICVQISLATDILLSRSSRLGTRKSKERSFLRRA